MTPSKERVVGRSVRRIDALEKVTGRARYVTDLDLPGMVHAKILRSPYPHARIVRIDTTAASAVVGVRAAVTSADLGWCDPYFGPAYLGCRAPATCRDSSVGSWRTRTAPGRLAPRASARGVSCP
jgi:CO/xanthine dehydrogenase Mo-binding subunit